MTAPPSFVHLRLHSEFSIHDGLVRIEDAIAQAKQCHQGALALTDVNNLFGWVRFYVQARKAGVKPLCGAEVILEADDDAPTAARVLLLARHTEGYHSLCRLLTDAWRDHQKHGIAYLPRQRLLEEKQGLMVLSGADRGDVGQALSTQQWDLARQQALWWKHHFGDDYFLEIHRVGSHDQDRVGALTVRLASELDIPLVATHPIQFLHQQDFKAHEARVCIAAGTLLADPKRPREYSEDQYFKSSEEMLALFHDLP